MRYSLEGFKKRVEVNRKQKMKIMEAEGLKNKRMMSKVMKGLLEVVYSVKVYSKRCEYLSKKYCFGLKSNVFSVWS